MCCVVGQAQDLSKLKKAVEHKRLLIEEHQQEIVHWKTQAEVLSERSPIWELTEAGMSLTKAGVPSIWYYGSIDQLFDDTHGCICPIFWERER